MKKLTALLLSLGLTAPAAEATWSIVVVDHATGEVAIASATCITNFALEDFLPVLAVGKGAIAAQSAVDTGAVNRTLGWDQLLAGSSPEEILDVLLTQGTAAQTRQYGVAGFAGEAATYSGVSVGDGICNLVGSFGSLSYAIQGNVITGEAVCFQAEEALLGTPGSLADRMVAAMDAARLMGGDGRCSCANNDPTGCGAPPPAFGKSAHTAFAFVARMGDPDGDCSGVAGCATGDYYMRLAFAGSALDRDPVDELIDQHAAWRAGLVGRADGLLSTAVSDAQRLPADGRTSARVTVALADLDGVAIGTGGATLTPALAGSSTGTATFGPVTDNGDGTYAFDVIAGDTPGSVELAISVDDGGTRATLFPYPSLQLDPRAALHVGAATLDPLAGGSVALTLDEPLAAGGQALLLASLSGTVPGIVTGGVTLPLNVDDAFFFTLQTANTGPLVNTFTTLDGSGYAQARFDAPPGFLASAAGLRLDWAALTLAGGTLGATNADGFDLVVGAR